MTSNLAYNDFVKLEEDLFEVDMNTTTDAKIKFSELKKDRIIIQGQFDDDKWLLSNQINHIGLDFVSIKENYEINYSTLISLNKNEFINILKSFCVYYIGKLKINTIQSFVSDCRKLIGIAPKAYIDNYKKHSLQSSFLVSVFFSALPIKKQHKKLVQIINILEIDKSEVDIRKQRTLSEYDSYFLFADVIDDYWKNEISNINKIYYFPVYLWWKLSSIIPIRPTELILTPRNCLTTNNGEYFITIRRTKLKGHNEKIHNKLNLDYKKEQVPIPDNLAIAIKDYLYRTKNYHTGEINTLFSNEAHYLKYNYLKVNPRSRYYTYFYLKKALQMFYEEIIKNKYGLKVEENNENFLEHNCINRIHLGDTRHLALQNCIFNFNDIEIAAALAGHERINTTAHYITNIPKMIKCATYREYRHIFDKKHNYKFINTANKSIINNSIPCNGGRCLSPSFKEKSFDDCYNSAGDTFLVGDCYGCEFFIPNSYLKYGEKAKEMEKALKTDLNNFFILFSHTIDTPEKQNDFKKAILKCNNSMDKYKRTCRMLFESEES